ncbi:MAG: glycosyltransferase family 4 protein [Candidatus Nanoarchaeia archaeon]|nr:glycosyltransferase family 4 protein [Candidatus Nanoarchaeia archaeon]
MKTNKFDIENIQLMAFNSVLTGGGVSTYLQSLRTYFNQKRKILTLRIKKNERINNKIMSYEFCLGAKSIFSEICYISPDKFINTIKMLKTSKILHFNSYTLSEVIFSYVAKLMRKKVIVTFHNNFIKNRKITLEQIRQILVNNLSVLISDKIVFVSFNQFKNVSKIILFKKILKRKSVVINNFIDKKMVLKRKRVGKKVKIIFVGRLTREKGYYDLLNLMGEKGLSDVDFSIIGKRHFDKDIIESKNIRYYNQIPNEEIFKIYDEHAVLILPSYTESFPMTILEAMARGLVILVSDIPGMREIIQEGRNGYLFPPGDVEKMKEIILYLKNNPKDVERISKNNLKDIWKFTAEKQVPRYIKIYEEVLKK